MAVTESASPPAELLPGSERSDAPIAVLGVAADPETTDGVGARFDADDRIHVEAVASPATAPTHVDAADCVVGESDLSDADRLELLATVRDHDPALPVVLLAADPSRAIRDALADLDWTDLVAPTDGTDDGDCLAERVRAVVGYRRATALARRSLAALAHCPDALAIVAPDGTLEFANPLFARQFGATQAELVGRPWQTLFPDDEASRLESDAFPSLSDGWRWIGDCELRRTDDTTFTAQIRIDALDDDGLVFAVSDRPDDEN